MQVGDLCFTGDGIAKKGVLIRHLVMPNLEDEGKEIMQWLAQNISKDVMVHIMEQYFPRAHVGKARRDKEKAGVRYEDINRPVDLKEVSSVREAAEQAGLWRFIEPAKHDGFNI